MTIDEAIAQEKELSEHCKRIFDETNEVDTLSNKLLRGKIGYHEQLAEWLEELKEFREISKKNPFLIDMIKHDKIVRNKAIDDLIEAAEKSQYGDIDGKEYVMNHLKALAEQLKVGGENEKTK